MDESKKNGKPDKLNKSKVLLVLFLLPMALGTTSLINNMNSGTREFSSLSALPDGIQRVLSDSFENSGEDGRKISVDGDDGEGKTVLNLSFNYNQEEGGIFDSPGEETLTIEIEAVTEGDIEVEYDGRNVECDCDRSHTIELEVPSNLLDSAKRCVPNEEADVEEADEDDGDSGGEAGGGQGEARVSFTFDIKDQEAGGTSLQTQSRSLAATGDCVERFRADMSAFLVRNKSNIISRIKDARLAQHGRNVEEKDCDNKDDEEDRIKCFINATSELSRDDDDEREDIFSKIEEEMEELNYSDEEEKELFDDMMDELRGVRYASDLRRKLRRHRDTRRFVDEERGTLNEINGRIEEVKKQLESAETQMQTAEMEFNNSQKMPHDFFRYQQQSQIYYNSRMRLNHEQMRLNTQFSRQRDRLQHQSSNMIREYQHNDIFNQADVDLASTYATSGYNFPHHLRDGGGVTRSGPTRSMIRNTGARRE